MREVAPATLRITASDGSDATARMTDRIAATLWSTGHPQRGGEWIQVYLGAVVPVALVRWLPGTYQEVPRGVRLEALGASDATARFAPEKIERVLLNLLTNALRHTPTDGSVAVVVKSADHEVCAGGESVAPTV